MQFLIEHICSVQRGLRSANIGCSRPVNIFNCLMNETVK